MKLATKLCRRIKMVPREHGYVWMVVGSSCSGKSLTIIRLKKLLMESERMVGPYVFCQPKVDRADLIDGVIRSRNKERIDAVSFSSKPEIEKVFHDNDVVVVDEIQLVSPLLQSFFLKELGLFVERGGIFVGVGLDFNSLGGEFIFSALLKSRSDKVHHLYSLCSMCGKPADRFDQRLINGIPARVDMPDFVGPTDSVTYEPRCADCLIIKK